MKEARAVTRFPFVFETDVALSRAFGNDLPLVMDEESRAKIQAEAEQVVLETNGVVRQEEPDSLIKFIAMVLNGEVRVEPISSPQDSSQQIDLGLA